MDSSGKARVKHRATVKGFKETGTSLPNMLKHIVFGKSEGDTIMQPVAIAAGPDGRLAIADIGCRCVHLYIPSEQKYVPIYAVKSGEIASPVGVAFDDELKLYVSDSVLGAIFVFDRSGRHLFSIQKAGNASLQRPTALTYSSDKKILYAVDTLSHTICAFNTRGDFLFSFGERGVKNGQFNFPTHIAVSPAGNLCVVDAMNFRVQVLDLSGKFLSAFGRHGDGSGDFSMPKGIAGDSGGVIYVVDSLFDNIQLFNLKGDFLLTIGGRGTGHGEFWLPSGIFLDRNDTLYVCDTYNRRIQMFQITRNGHE
jgi:DNA-binding beta-propeller fold protein YncE